ncbi:hypothetical protein GF337_17075 [candidate division KSB1 bacterium]|nr:hypothetical protein [candidate division KSB1 bacterium]
MKISQKFAFCFLLIACLQCSKTKNPLQNPEIRETEFQSENVSYQSIGLTLNGVLTIPLVEDDVPGVLIINRFGQIDRDGEIVDNDSVDVPIYKMLAEYLSSHNFAVLRYDKRSLPEYNIGRSNISEYDQLKDIHASINFLRNRSEVDENSIFIIGHEEGGNLASVAASEKDAIKGIVLIASPAFAVDTLMLARITSDPNTSNEVKFYTRVAFNYFRNNHKYNYIIDYYVMGYRIPYWCQWMNYSQNADSIITNLNKDVFAIQGLADETYPSGTLERNLECWNCIASQSESIEFKAYEKVTHLLLDKNTSEVSEAVLEGILVWMYENSITRYKGRVDISLMPSSLLNKRIDDQ